MARESELLREITENYTNDVNEWQDAYEQGETDEQVLTGNVWQALDPEGTRQRVKANRPMLAPDELNQYINQGVNDWLANPRGVTFAPAGLGATDAAAAFYQHKTREIEYRSHANVAYGTAVENMFRRGYGYVRVDSKYVHGELFDTDAPPDFSYLNQELWIGTIPDPNMVLPDPYCERADLGDMKRCFVLQWRSVRDFKRDFPGAKVRNFNPAITNQAPEWFSKDRKQVLVAEYWTKDVIGSRELLVLKPVAPTSRNPNPQPTAIWADQRERRPNSDRIMASRDVPICAVKQRLTNGIEILEEHDWKGQYIPITGCFGKIVYVDDGLSGSRKIILSMTRLARDPFMLYAYITTCEAEIIGGVPKFPYFYYDGQLSPESLDLLAQSVSTPVVGIPVKPFIPGMTPPGQTLPFPTRNPYDGSSIQFLEIAKESARRAIQAAMGVTPLPTPVLGENQKSGAALDKIEASTQRGSFHFINHADAMVQQVGEIIQDHMEHTYDTARDVAIRLPSGKGQTVPINQPGGIDTRGSFQVTVSAGPAEASQRAQADQLVDTMVGNIDKVAAIAGQGAARSLMAQSIKQRVLGPEGEALAAIIAPPQGAPIDPAIVQQLQAENQALKQAVQSKTAEKQVEQQGKFATAQMQEQAESERNRENNEVKLAVATLNAKFETLANAMTLFMEERNRIGAQIHERVESGAQRLHEKTEGAANRLHDLVTADQVHHHALQQATQAADLAPEPTDNGNGAPA